MRLLGLWCVVAHLFELSCDVAVAIADDISIPVADDIADAAEKRSAVAVLLSKWRMQLPSEALDPPALWNMMTAQRELASRDIMVSQILTK